MKAEILSWSRARGVFGGISLAGSTMRSDDGANKSLYGKELSAKEIVLEGKVKTPKAGTATNHSFVLRSQSAVVVEIILKSLATFKNSIAQLADPPSFAA